MNTNNIKKQEVWFTSDLHISHGNIIKYSNRPFMSDYEKEIWNNINKNDRNEVKRFRISQSSIEFMNTSIIDNINAVVGEDDILWMLGDFGFFDSFETAKRYRNRIICKNLNLIWGNHDKDYIRPLFNEAYDQRMIYVNGQQIVLNHYSMAIWEDCHKGAWHLYGHSHNSHEKWKNEHMPDAKSFDVGVDSHNYMPLSFNDVKKIMDAKPSSKHVADHHV